MNFYDDEDSVQYQEPELDETLEALRNIGSAGLTTTIFYGLSNLSVDEAEQLRPVWAGLAPAQRRKIMRELVESAESNFEFDYQAVGNFGIEDDDPGVREAAIEVLWEDDSLELMNRLIDIVQWDEVREVRAAAMSALGRFILKGELGELAEDDAVRAQDVAIQSLTNLDEDIDVRRRALEAISNSSHEMVEEAISEAYESTDRRMQVSSVFAMGRNYDANLWGDIVLRELDSSDAEMLYEAARAAGELELVPAVMALSHLAFSDDREVKEVAIWSLGEIGGNESLRVLAALADAADEESDDDLAEAIQDAIGSATTAGGDLPLSLLDD